VPAATTTTKGTTAMRFPLCKNARSIEPFFFSCRCRHTHTHRVVHDDFFARGGPRSEPGHTTTTTGPLSKACIWINLPKELQRVTRLTTNDTIARVFSTISLVDLKRQQPTSTRRPRASCRRNDRPTDTELLFRPAPSPVVLLLTLQKAGLASLATSAFAICILAVCETRRPVELLRRNESAWTFSGLGGSDYGP
jgi:hypothetical protein